MIKKEEIGEIFLVDGEKIMNDMEIEQNELIDISHNLAEAWYIDSLNIPLQLKRDLLRVQLSDIKTYAQFIIKKIDETLESEEFNHK